MRYFAHRLKRPFYLHDHRDCWIVQDDSGKYYLVSLAVGRRMEYKPRNWASYEELLEDIGIEVSGIGSLEYIPEELRVDAGL